MRERKAIDDGIQKGGFVGAYRLQVRPMSGYARKRELQRRTLYTSSELKFLISS